MRGKLLDVRGQHVAPGITPAHAGKTARSAWRFMAAKDHPRACGENRIRAQFVPACPGSPPRMRGKLGYYEKDKLSDRITPAHAGKT